MRTGRGFGHLLGFHNRRMIGGNMFTRLSIAEWQMEIPVEAEDLRRQGWDRITITRRFVREPFLYELSISKGGKGEKVAVGIESYEEAEKLALDYLDESIKEKARWALFKFLGALLIGAAFLAAVFISS